MDFLKRLFGKKMGGQTQESQAIEIEEDEDSFDCQSVIKKLVRNSIQMSIDSSESGHIGKGASKYGGKPDVPENFEWPYYKFVDGKGTEKEVPLSFLLQVDCGQIAQFDTDKLLPESGILCFFYDLQSMTWGYDPIDKGSARVYYFDLSQAVKGFEFPNDLDPEYRLPEMPIGFCAKPDLPYFEEFHMSQVFEYEFDSEEYDEAREAFGCEFGSKDRHKLLGYADPIQGPMLLECELSTNGIYTGSPANLSEEQEELFQGKCKEWKLLMQLDTVTKGDFELMFGDVGHIYFYIRENDLASRNFENCWLVLQCS
ncbi:MAG: YwqG family protein [Eubacteriaceae bacterium]|nr:YwqG family protein [Eubacteriaceae bacterium]